jgi:hypothetical protein
VRPLAANDPPTIIQQEKVVMAENPGRHSSNESRCSTDGKNADEIPYTQAGTALTGVYPIRQERFEHMPVTFHANQEKKC